MKTKILALIPMVLLTACASITQDMTTTTTDPKTGVVTQRNTKVHGWAFFDSKNMAQSITSANGATQKTGIQGLDQETTSAGTVEIMKALIAAGVAMGKASAVP
jgi:hypothetical protein